MSEHRPITLHDVALESGVHASTVSRTLSRPDLVNATTLARVSAAVERLGYVPNRAARQLAGGATATLAVLVPDITNPFFSMLVQAAQRRARAAATLVLLADTAQNAATEIDAVRSLAPNVDGLVLCSPVAPTDDLRSASGGRPLLFVNRRARGVASISVDQRLIVGLAVDHLRALGHRRIAVVRGPSGYWSSTQRDRHLERLGDGLVAFGPTEASFEGGGAIVDEVLASDVTAVAAFNDVMALGVIAGAELRGRCVPDDLSVTGADGVPLGTMTSPTLTTVASPLGELGALAIDLLFARLAGGPADQHTIEPRLITRQSTAPPRRRHG